MAMVAGILAIVAAILKPIADGIGNCIADPIKDRFKYLCCFTDNVKDLEKEAPKLENIRCEVQSRVERAQNNAEIVVPRVQTWLNNVSEIQTEKLKIDSEIITTINGGCSIVGCRYSVSKRVKKMAEAMKELRQEVNDFHTIANPQPAEAIVPINIRSTTDLHSRKHVEDDIMSSLRDEKTYKVGICGMGGVGKTTMAEKVMQRAREELGFEETVMAVVGQKVDEERIQDDIATSLGLKWKGNSSSKAHELRQRLSADTKRSLIVIDDVWERLDLAKLGIPCSNTCKVLITSRNSHILNVQKLHAVDVLSEKEAWELFRSKAGSCIEQQNVVDVARHVVDECKGLPLALVTVGVTLKNKATTPWWSIALQQLKSANPIHTPEVIKPVYQQLRLSYDFLETDAQKSLFLMCCLFPEDSNIPLERLASMCKGLLHLNEDIKSSRDATLALVEGLKDRFLLLEGYNKNHVKMHDVVRDVAIFIAAKESRIKCRNCTWISPNIGQKIGLHGGSSLFQNLRFLWIDHNSSDKELEIYDKSLKATKSKLNVFIIQYPSLQRLPETIGLLTNLRTLVLEDCESLKSISVVGKLGNLEILICRFCEMIERLPIEIGTLSQLRLLEVSQCRNLKEIAPGIISKLIKLEELIVEEFDGWEGRIVEGERKNASLCELEHLSELTRLKIVIRDSGLAAENLGLPPKLRIFNITIGEGLNLYSSWEKSLTLELSRDTNFGEWIQKCVENVESLHIEGDGSSVLDLGKTLNLKELKISKCSSVMNTHFHQLEVLRLVELSELEEICDISNLKKLCYISIEECDRLRRLCSLSVMESGDCFLNLARLEIERCGMLRQVFMWNEEEQNQINIRIPKLNFIKLHSLPWLTSFIKGIKGIEFPQLAHMCIEECPRLKEFVSGGSPAHHWGDDKDFIYLSDNPHKVTFDMLRKLEIRGVRNLFLQPHVYFFTSHITMLSLHKLEGVRRLFLCSLGRSYCFYQLEKLEISNCKMMEEVLVWEKNNIQDTTLLFPKLKLIKLDDLPRLRSFSKGIEATDFPQLEEIAIMECPLLEQFVYDRSSALQDANGYDFIHLSRDHSHKVKIGMLSKLHVRWVRNLYLQAPVYSFTSLTMLSVYELGGVKSLFSLSVVESGCCFLHLERLEIKKCDMMEHIFTWNEEEQNQTNIHIPPFFPKLKLMELDSLPRLTSFTNEIMQVIEFPQHAKVYIKHCPLLREVFVCSGSPAHHHGDYNDSLHLSYNPHKSLKDSLNSTSSVSRDRTQPLRYECDFDSEEAVLQGSGEKESSNVTTDPKGKGKLHEQPDSTEHPNEDSTMQYDDGEEDHLPGASSGPLNVTPDVVQPSGMIQIPASQLLDHIAALDSIIHHSNIPTNSLKEMRDALLSNLSTQKKE